MPPALQTVPPKCVNAEGQLRTPLPDGAGAGKKRAAPSPPPSGPQRSAGGVQVSHSLQGSALQQQPGCESPLARPCPSRAVLLWRLSEATQENTAQVAQDTWTVELCRDFSPWVVGLFLGQHRRFPLCLSLIAPSFHRCCALINILKPEVCPHFCQRTQTARAMAWCVGRVKK